MSRTFVVWPSRVEVIAAEVAAWNQVAALLGFRDELAASNLGGVWVGGK
jgi:hypothetical protein